MVYVWIIEITDDKTSRWTSNSSKIEFIYVYMLVISITVDLHLLVVGLVGLLSLACLLIHRALQRGSALAWLATATLCVGAETLLLHYAGPSPLAIAAIALALIVRDGLVMICALLLAAAALGGGTYYYYTSDEGEGAGGMVLAPSWTAGHRA